MDTAIWRAIIRGISSIIAAVNTLIWKKKTPSSQDSICQEGKGDKSPIIIAKDKGQINVTYQETAAEKRNPSGK